METEPDETFMLTLTNAANADIGSPDSATVTIQANNERKLSSKYLFAS